MRTVSPELAAHLGSASTTLCRCWKLVRRDGQTFGFTDHDRALAFDGVEFEAASGVSAGEMQQGLGLNAESQEIVGALTSDRISPADIRADRYDGARVEVFLVNWAIPSQRLLEHVFTVGEITRRDGAFHVELRSLTTDLSQTRGRNISRLCDADLGDGLCGIDLAVPLWSAEGSVLAVRSALCLEIGGLSAFAANHFRGGRLSLVSGPNSGVAVEISGHEMQDGIAIISLWKPFAFDLAVTDAVRLTAGCDKHFATCRDRFANSVNFRGFPHIPGNDFALGYASSFEVMDGGVLIP